MYNLRKTNCGWLLPALTRPQKVTLRRDGGNRSRERGASRLLFNYELFESC
jgi:hypothetical protein